MGSNASEENFNAYALCPVPEVQPPKEKLAARKAETIPPQALTKPQMFDTSPVIRDACFAGIRAHAETVTEMIAPQGALRAGR
jgi:hypothetical protein